ncbi:DUF3857 domain-containing protein [Candidatus Jidaibacter acanthamoebae]|nr:DUF3857 domain-containing protein [Candidatus Jidaibacter acanthamoeba]
MKSKCISFLNFFSPVICMVILLSNAAEARWATYDDASIEINKYNVIETVNKDGTNESIIEEEKTILKEHGRDYAANYVIKYNGDSSKVTILEAKTIYQGKEYKVDQDMIEDKPLASSHQGFDQQRQILIAYPKAEIGAKIYIKYKISENKVPLANTYFSRAIFGLQGYEKESNIEIRSELPLKYYANDPNKALKITQLKENNLSVIKIKLIKPLYTETIGEPTENTIINNKYITSVSISSLDTWEEVGTRFGKDYSRVITRPLPKAFEEIVSEVKKSNLTEKEQIERVISLLNDKVRYMGDWRTVNGRMIPRDLDKVATSQLGDCKDFSASTAAILNKLGFKARVTLVMRGIMRQSYDEPLPNIYSFNHAMLKVIGKSREVYWIDPTNFQSMADGIFPDIAGKKVLVLDTKEPSYETIPEIDPNHSQMIKNNIMELKSDGAIFDTGSLTIKGEERLQFSGMGLYFSKKAIEDFLFRAISKNHLTDEEKKSIEVPDLTKREVRDITVKYSYEHKNSTFKTNLGQALTLSSEWLRSFTNVAHDQIGDIMVGPPITLKRSTVLKDMKVKNIQSLNYEIKSPWLYFKRECKNKGKDIEIFDTVKILKTFITGEQLNSEEYKNLKQGIERNIQKAALIFTE